LFHCELRLITYRCHWCQCHDLQSAVTEPSVPTYFLIPSPFHRPLNTCSPNFQNRLLQFIDLCHCHCQSMIQMVTPYNIKLVFVLKIAFVLTKSNRNCCHHQYEPNRLSSGASPQTPLGSWVAPRPPSCIQGGLLLKGEEGTGRRREGRRLREGVFALWRKRNVGACENIVIIPGFCLAYCFCFKYSFSLFDNSYLRTVD